MPQANKLICFKHSAYIVQLPSIIDLIPEIKFGLTMNNKNIYFIIVKQHNYISKYTKNTTMVSQLSGVTAKIVGHDEQ